LTKELAEPKTGKHESSRWIFKEMDESSAWACRSRGRDNKNVGFNRREEETRGKRDYTERTSSYEASSFSGFSSMTHKKNSY